MSLSRLSQRPLHVQSCSELVGAVQPHRCPSLGKTVDGFQCHPRWVALGLGRRQQLLRPKQQRGCMRKPLYPLFFRITSTCVRAWPNERESVQSSCGDEYWHFQFSFWPPKMIGSIWPTAHVRYIRIASYSLEERCSKTQSSMEIVLVHFTIN